MADVKQILENLGYKLNSDGFHYYRAKPLYRDSNNATALRISKKTGWFIDFPRNLKGSLADLIQLTLNLKDVNEAKSWLATHEFDTSYSFDEKPLITGDKTYPIELLNKLVINHSYWNERDIPSDVVEKYSGGVAISGSMARRYIFPIFDEHERLIGFAGRDITNKNEVKWMLVGDKKKWSYPIDAHSFIKTTQEAILVESIGDMLALDRAGIRNALVLFGLNLGDKILSTLVRLNPSKIIIATNNDSKNKSAGNKSALVIKDRLNKFFEEEKVIIHLPTDKNDFGEMTDEEIREWYNNCPVESPAQVAI